MARTMPKEMTDQLEAFNSEVRFCSVVESVYETKDGKPTEDHKLDRAGNPINRRAVRAELYNRADGKQWLNAEGGTEEDAFAKVLERAKTADRPASTAIEVIAERDSLKERLAVAEAELVRVRRQESTIHVDPGVSQRRMAQAPTFVPPPPIHPHTEPGPIPSVFHDETPAADDKTELQELLRNAGVPFDGRVGVAALRELAGRHKLIPII